MTTAADSDDLIDRLAELPLIQQPGTAYFYGMNTTVLGLVAERATGKSLNQLVSERLAEGVGTGSADVAADFETHCLP